MIWDKVWAIGRENYIRFYPNPGVGFMYWPRRRAAISWRGGVEIFRKDPLIVWRRIAHFMSRVNRPGSR